MGRDPDLDLEVIRGCARKRKYSSLSRVERIRADRESNGAGSLRSYLCPICGSYHLTKGSPFKPKLWAKVCLRRKRGTKFVSFRSADDVTELSEFVFSTMRESRLAEAFAVIVMEKGGTLVSKYAVDGKRLVPIPIP